MRAIGVLGSLIVTVAAATSTAAEPPAALKPSAIAGSGINVRNLEGQKDWYLEKLGMKLINTYSRGGKPYEYIVGYEGPGGSVLALLASANRPAGANQMSRVILLAPNAKALAEHLKGLGVTPREVVADVAYFIEDPEGNPIELYTPPAPQR